MLHNRKNTHRAGRILLMFMTATAASTGYAERPVPPYESQAFPAQQEVTEKTTLSEYLTLAALNNPGLEAAFNEWKAAGETIEQAASLPDPQLSFAYFIEEVETRVGPQEGKIGVMQMFPWFGTLRHRGGAAEETARIAYQKYQAQKLDVFAQVKKAYYEYYYLLRSIEITRQNIDLLSNLESVARSKYRAGAPQTGVLKAQVELGKLSDQLRSFQELRAPLAARLNATLNRPLEADLPWPQNPSFHSVDLDEKALTASLEENNPELLALAASVKEQEHQRILARKAGLPDFALGVDYVFTGDAMNAALPDSGKDPIIAMASLRIPLWRGKIRAGIEEAKRKEQAAEHVRQERKNRLSSELKMALFRYRDAERKINLYGHNLLPQAHQSLEVNEEAYRSGTGDFLNLIDAERLHLEFQLTYEKARKDRELALADIEALTGQPLPLLSHTQKKEIQ